MPSSTRPVALLTAALSAGALLAAGPVPVASAAKGDVFGKDTNQFGTTTLRFSRGYTTIVLSKRLAKNAGGKSFVVSCRTPMGKYKDVVGTVPLSARRTIRVPGAPPSGISRCRIRRSNTLIIATMNVAKL
jgi:hypothetical protein